MFVSTKALSFVRRKPVPVVNVHNGRRPSNLGLPGHSRVRLEGGSGPAAFVSAVAILDGAPSSICFFLTTRIVPSEGIVELRVFHLRSVSIQRMPTHLSIQLPKKTDLFVDQLVSLRAKPELDPPRGEMIGYLHIGHRADLCLGPCTSISIQDSLQEYSGEGASCRKQRPAFNCIRHSLTQSCSRGRRASSSSLTSW